MFTILHLETSTLYRKLIHEICDELDIRYLSAACSEDAFTFLKNESISLIISAMELEDSPSGEFVVRLNESEYRTVPVVVITGNDSVEDRKKMYELGIVDYIVKKASREEITENLHAYKFDRSLKYRLNDLSYAVVDDSKVDRKIIERIFSMNGIFKAAYFASEEELFSSGIFYDVYLVDLVLKESSGHRIISRLRERGHDSVIITISGIDNVKTISRVLALGANDYISKPYNHEIFMARLTTNIRNLMLYREVKQKSAELERMAVTDGLTGLYNHKYSYERLDEEVKRAERYETKLSVIMLDIDKFKNLNDTYGHRFGDAVLTRVAEIIRSVVRDVDIAGRYGGEEFIVILPETDLDGAAETAERLRKRISCVKFSRDGNGISVSGGVVVHANGEKPGQMINRADILLYKAKNSGRNNIQK